MPSTNSDQPDPEFMAEQLRKPSGDHAAEVGQKMDYVNEALFDLTLETMQLKDNEQILEIGFGTGSYLERILNEAEDLTVCGIDFSDEMVKMATKENREAIEAGKVTLGHGSSEDIPYSDSVFDKVFCNMVIYFWDQPHKHLNEVHRVLKPGGTFYTGIRSRPSMQAFPFVEHGFNLYGTGEWKEILSENGFSVINHSIRNDPELDLEEHTLRLESHCIVAAKNEIDD